ncbi:MAG: Gfo/Idh/MocA family oxidoreductase, partial [Terriglobia bacterium]
FALELDAFAECIVNQEDPAPDGIQGLRDVAVMQAIYQAARARHSVPVVFPV